jgi:ATPase family AAA domain-containing protein 2
VGDKPAAETITVIEVDQMVIDGQGETTMQQSQATLQVQATLHNGHPDNGIVDQTVEPLQAPPPPPAETAPKLFDIDLDKIYSYVAKSRYLTPDEFLDDIKKIVYNAEITQYQDLERLQRAQAMQAAAELSLQFDTQFSLECGRMAVREHKRREVYRKIKEKEKQEKAAKDGSGPHTPPLGARRSARQNGQAPEIPITDPEKLARRLKRQRTTENGGLESTGSEEENLGYAGTTNIDGLEGRETKRTRLDAMEEDDEHDPLDLVSTNTPVRNGTARNGVHFNQRVETIPPTPPSHIQRDLLNQHAHYHAAHHPVHFNQMGQDSPHQHVPQYGVSDIPMQIDHMRVPSHQSHYGGFGGAPLMHDTQMPASSLNTFASGSGFNGGINRGFNAALLNPAPPAEHNVFSVSPTPQPHVQSPTHAFGNQHSMQPYQPHGGSSQYHPPQSQYDSYSQPPPNPDNLTPHGPPSAPILQRPGSANPFMEPSAAEQLSNSLRPIPVPDLRRDFPDQPTFNPDNILNLPPIRRSKSPQPERMPTPTPGHLNSDVKGDNSEIQTDVTVQIERTPTPLPDFVCDDALVENLRQRLKQTTAALNVEQLEQLRATCLSAVWRHRKEWDRSKLIDELMDIAAEFVEEVQGYEDGEDPMDDM